MKNVFLLKTVNQFKSYALQTVRIKTLSITH